MAALKSIAAYQAEHMHEPVDLPLADGTTVSFPQPSYREFRAKIEEAGDDIDALCLFAPEADREDLRAALEALPTTAPRAIAVDLYTAWGMGNTQASPSS